MPEPSHHPDDSLLLDYVAGGMPRPLALVIATHLALCPSCRNAARDYEAIGGVLLADIEPAAVSDDLLARTMAWLDQELPAPAGLQPSAVEGDPRMPSPLRAAMGRPMAQLPWRRFGRTIAEAVLIPFEDGFQASLLRVKAGGAIPRHTHRGQEVTLLLEGSFCDESGTYRRGDVAVAGPHQTHRPQAGQDGDCLCVIATERPPRFTGLLGPLLNLMTRR